MCEILNSERGYAWDAFDGVYRCPICDETWLSCAETCTKEQHEACEAALYKATEKKEEVVMRKVVITNNPNKAKFHALQNPNTIVTAVVTRLDKKVQFLSIEKGGLLFFRPEDKFDMPDEYGWATCKMQTV